MGCQVAKGLGFRLNLLPLGIRSLVQVGGADFFA